MHIRTFARTVAAVGALAVPLSTMAPARAAETPGADYAHGATPPHLPDPRPEWTGPSPIAPAPVVMQVDPHTRDLWLAECRRRMDISYSGRWDDDYGWKRHRRHRDEVRTTGSDYCEVYFDDYYRHYSQAGYGYAAPVMMRATQSAPAAQNCVTEEHVSYVPVRTRYIPRRHTKRVPDKRIRLQGS